VTGPTYTIRTMRDFLRVPRARRVQCLTEFLGWLAHVEVAMLRDAPSDIGPFIWTDDGHGGIRVEPDDRRPNGHHEELRLR